VNPPLRKIFYWSARLLGILVIFIVVQMHLSPVNLSQSFGQVLVSLLSHGWMTLILVAALAIAWRWEIPGAGIYLGITIWNVVDMGKTEVFYYLFLAAPYAVIAILFLISGLMKAPKAEEVKGSAVK
jgi:hypothetical protein